MREYKRYRTVDLCLTFRRKSVETNYNPVRGSSGNFREMTSLHFIYDNFSYFDDLTEAEELQIANTDIDWPTTAILLDKLRNVRYYHVKNTKFKLETLDEISKEYMEEFEYLMYSDIGLIGPYGAFADMIYYGFEDFSQFLERNSKYDFVRKTKQVGSVHLMAPEFPRVNYLFNLDKDLYIGINKIAINFIPTVVPLEYIYSRQNKVIVL